ncbi:MAG: cysteine desulfurase [Candidatus Micrarchaeota archaeon]|nr:cysteine desulfurase [Candidatus Micrarchaeota archaeon]
MSFNIDRIRADFPILNKKINGKNIIYFDNACQTLRPVQVIKKINEYYEEYPACAGRSNHKLSERLNEEIENSRKKIANFFNAKENEIIFTKNTTEGINLIAHSFNFKEGDVILLSDKEHNSNLIPWQMLKKKKVKIRFFKFGDLEDFSNKIDKNVKLASFVYTSNIDGTTQPVEKMIKIAHDNGTFVLIDGAQAAPHKKIDLKRLNPDAFACSGHKMLGPSGTGILYLSEKSSSYLSEFMTGGETVRNSTYDNVEFQGLPYKYEAGLQNYSGIIGLSAAVEYLKNVGVENIEKHEIKLNEMITEELSHEIEEGTIQLLGPKDANLRGGIFSFNVKGIPYHQISLLLDQNDNIMIRSGQHCVHSWFNANKIDGSARVSLYLYNSKEEVMVFVKSLSRIISLIK